MRETVRQGVARAMTVEEAEVTGARALLFLASDPERLVGLMAVTGLAPADLTGRAGEPALLGALLEHLLHAEPLLLAFAAEHDVRPERVQPAADILADLAGGHATPAGQRRAARDW